MMSLVISPSPSVKTESGIGSPLAVAGLGVSLAASVGAVVFGLRGSRWGFRLVIVAALVDVALLVLAGSALTAG